MFAIDVSNYSGVFDHETARLLRDSNRRIIIGTQDVAIAIGQATHAIASCLDVHLYAFCYPDVPLTREIDTAKEVAQALGFKPFLWLDFELPMNVSPDVVNCWIGKAINAAKDFQIGIYTRRTWWEEYTGNTNEWAYLPLWDANWDNVGELMANFMPYGGWTEPAMKQYKNDMNVWGVKVNLNVY